MGSEPRSMRKFYRFSVMNPVDMSSVCTSIKGNPLVELQLRNTTQVLAWTLCGELLPFRIDKRHKMLLCAASIAERTLASKFSSKGGRRSPTQ